MPYMTYSSYSPESQLHFVGVDAHIDPKPPLEGRWVSRQL